MSFRIARFLLRKRSDEAESCCRTREGIRKAVTGIAALRTIKVPSSRIIPLGFLSLCESKWLRHETRRMRKTPHLSRLFQNTHYILIRAKPQLLPQLSLFILPAYNASSVLFENLSSFYLAGCASFVEEPWSMFITNSVGCFLSPRRD